MLAIEITFFILFAFAIQQSFHSQMQKSLLSTLDALSHLRMQLNLRCFQKEEAKEDHKDLFEILLEAYFKGRSLDSAFEWMEEQIVKEEEFRLAKQRLLSLFMMRILFVCGASLFARNCMRIYFDLGAETSKDLLCLLMGFGLAFSFFKAVRYFYPPSWFWKHGLQEEACECLRAHFYGELPKSCPIYKPWIQMSEQEYVSGISLASTKALLLNIWRSKRNIEFQERLRIFEDYLPVLEFISLGLATGLILASPILKILDF